MRDQDNMDKIQARNLVKETFENSFDENRFRYFIGNLLNHFDERNERPHCGQYIPEAFRSRVGSFERIGKYADGENEIDILIVNLKKGETLERARTAQRNFAAWYLNGSRGGKQKDGALIAFVAPDTNDWRFSLVKMDYKFEEGSNGKTKVIQDFTPARRWSFLVGANENSHTAQSRLSPIVENDNLNPAFKDLEDAFSVEKVTNEFFEEYRKLFEILHGELTQNHTFLIQAEKFGISPENFAKKLLGQLVFLYFLQRKGWLGAQKDKPLNFGDKNFLMNLFLGKYRQYTNFFNDILEPLFYGALNKPTDKAGNFWRDYFSCQVPFLNGGLFEAEYKWEQTNICLDNKIFENILEVFGRYNFTVKEDEPLEKEVAIDPEMLGKVFENLLHENLRKGKGTYYTPREIVYYMCRQSLINYLSAISPGNEFEQKITKFVNGETMISEEEILKIGDENDAEIAAQRVLIFSKNEARAIDKFLADIKICDPACGSGAFLVGMLNEIVRMRKFLDDWHLGKKTTEYQLKKETIQNCVYGVDIDPGAIEIAKLRLWLALVVDYELAEIEPLPNLDYRLMCGNSLLEEYDGVKFNIDEEKKLQGELFGGDKTYESKIALLKAEIRNYFYIHNVAEKLIQRKKINDLKDWFIDSALTTRTNQLARELKEANEISGALSEKNRNKFWESHGGKQLAAMKLQELKKDIHNPKAEKPFFLWKLEFSDVFSGANPGFDIVIANPPYVSALDAKKVIEEKIRDCYKNKFFSAKGAYDLYVIFFEQGLSILKKGGVLIYISPSKYLSAKYAVSLRELILKYSIISIVDFSKIKIFESANVSTLVTLIKNSKDKIPVKTVRFFSKDIHLEVPKTIENEREILSFLPEKLWGFLLSDNIDLVKKIWEMSIPCLDVAEINASSTAREADEYTNYIKEKNNDVEYLKIINTRTIEHIFNTWGRIEYKNKDKKIMTPYIDTSMVNKRRANMYFEPKLIFSKVAKSLTASYDKYGKFASTNTNFLYKPKKLDIGFLAAYFNSKLANFMYSQLFGGLNMFSSFQFQAPQLRLMPVPKIVKQQKPFVEIVDKILAITKSGDYLENPAKQAKVKEYEKQIDQMVYELYGLTDAEIKIVEGR